MIDAIQLASDEQAEAHRLQVLADHQHEQLLGSPALKRITDFAAALCETPIALVSLVEQDRQSFLARSGLDAAWTERDVSFCTHAMSANDIMIVTDASADPRFADNPLVTGDPNIRFYAGAPLVTSEGVPLGALCVIDDVQRAGLTPLQQQGLLVLAEQVMQHLQSHRGSLQQQEAARVINKALAHSEERFRVLADAMPQMVWSTLPDGHHDYYNARWYEFTGMAEGTTDGEEWNGMFHPDDRERAWARWRQSLATGEPYQVEYRLRAASGEYRWTLGRALPLRNDTGEIVRWFGTCTDIHEQKLIMDQREIISQELSHRIKNIFSVISGLIGFAARTHPGFSVVADDLRERITALGRAHDFVRPHSARSRPAQFKETFKGLLEALFLPYQSADAQRIRITGDDMPIDDRSATPLALLFHELATNASKYGALSVQEGGINIVIAVDASDLVVTWTEHGGPPVVAPGIKRGFGSQLIDMSVTRQLGGRIDYQWLTNGIVVTTRIPMRAFARV